MINDRSIKTVAFIIGFLLIFILKTTIELHFPEDIRYVGQIQHYMFNILVALLLTLIFENGTERLNTYLDSKIPWFDAVNKRIILQFLITIVLAFLTILIISYIFVYFLHLHSNKAVVFYRYLTLGTIYSLILSTIYTGVHFFRQWGHTHLEAERLKQENLRAQNTMLKQQLSPHFLFNSLSTLSGLITEDQEQANSFVQKLSDVYRYVLQSIDKTTVNLRTEIKAVEAYVFLHQTRLGDNLKVNIDISEESKDTFIAPLTLQILLENAIKHNVISGTKPLTIEITDLDGKFVVVKNNIQKKISIESSDHVGLQNIINRYRFLANSPVEIKETSSEFIVTVPLIKEIRL